MQSVRAKFTVETVTSHRWNKNAKTVKLFAQYDDGIEENRRFAQATPSGCIEIQIDNPAAADFFELGKSVYVDFSAAE